MRLSDTEVAELKAAGFAPNGGGWWARGGFAVKRLGKGWRAKYCVCGSETWVDVPGDLEGALGALRVHLEEQASEHRRIADAYEAAEV